MCPGGDPPYIRPRSYILLLHWISMKMWLLAYALRRGSWLTPWGQALPIYDLGRICALGADPPYIRPRSYIRLVIGTKFTNGAL